MKYFMDFEATQFDMEIISVGCVDEEGREFYSLVRPHGFRKMTSFITELTGITTEQLKQAPKVDDVFSDFYDFIDKTEKAEFFCYGNCDGRFVKTSLKYVQTFKAQSMLSTIYGNLVDVSPEMSHIFKTNQTISLYKLSDYYGAAEDQNHHALNDAKLLKHVYMCSRGETLEECPFPEYVQQGKTAALNVTAPEPAKVPHVTASQGNDVFSFSSYGKAADWIITQLLPKDVMITLNTKSNISNRIVQAVANGNTYHGYTWTAPAKRGK
jgi:inhibitor of KinA sporulation pathway (predicted exonuclease)